MSFTRFNRFTCCLALVVGSALTATALAAQAQGRLSAPGGRPLAVPRPGNENGGVNLIEAPGEVLVRLAPGADAHGLAAHYGATATALHFTPDTYLFEGVQGSLAGVVADLRNQFGVLVAETNRYYFPSTLPQVPVNDPLARRQWALDVLDAPESWGITVGERLVGGPRPSRNGDTVTVGLVDFPPDSAFHPDLFDIINESKGFDFINGVPYDPFLNAGVFFAEGHGTNVAGCIAIANNNGEGLAGIPWEGVEIAPCSVGERVTANNVTTSVIRASAVLDAVNFCIQQNFDIINMSFGLPLPAGQFTDPLVAGAVQDAYDSGILVVAAVGDSVLGFGNTDFPANLSGLGGGPVIAVTSVGPSGELSPTANFGGEVAAPGGSDPSGLDDSRQVLVADSSSAGFALIGNTFIFNYTFKQGTSLAAGYVSGLLATLISQGAIEHIDAEIAADPNVFPPSTRVEALREIIHNTARNPSGVIGGGFGFGIVNAQRALQASTHWIDFRSPLNGEVTESFAEPLVAQIVQATLPLPPAPTDVLVPGVDFTVVQNGVDVTADTVVTGTAIRHDPTPGRPGDVYLAGVNSVDVSAASTRLANDPTAIRSTRVDQDVFNPISGRLVIPTRSYTFVVRPKLVNPGLQTFSIPFKLQDGANTLRFLSGGRVVAIARWVPETASYAIFYSDTSPQDPEAALDTTNAGVAKPPIGVGFWARVNQGEAPPPPSGGGGSGGSNAPVQLQILGEQERSGIYEIPLRPGWNLIADPYRVRVPWNTVRVRFGLEVLSINEATQRGLMRNALWRYEETATGRRYTFKIPPTAELIPWEAQWVFSNADVTLIVPRVESSNVDTQASAGSAMKMAAAETIRVGGVVKSRRDPLTEARSAMPRLRDERRWAAKSRPA